MEGFLLPNSQQVEDLKEVLTKRNILLDKKLSLTVEPGKLGIALTVDVPTPYIYVVCNAGASSDFDVVLQDWTVKEGGNNKKTAIETVIRAKGLVHETSPWIPAKGQEVTVRVRNNDDVARTFDVHVFGVR